MSLTSQILLVTSLVGLGSWMSCLPSVADQTVTATVLTIRDGDTITVQDPAQQTRTIRLVCIDAPEFTQEPWGLAATKQLERILSVGDTIQLRVVEEDDYERWIAEVYVGETSVNLQMVATGHAVVYRRFLDNCAASQDQFLATEAAARSDRLGFWNQANPEMPWDYRRRQP